MPLGDGVGPTERGESWKLQTSNAVSIPFVRPFADEEPIGFPYGSSADVTRGLGGRPYPLQQSSGTPIRSKRTYDV